MARRNVVTSAEAPEMTQELAQKAENLERGTAFDWSSGYGWSQLYDDDGLVVSVPERTLVADIEAMLDEGGQPQAVLSALQLPLRQANLTIETPENDQGQTELVRDELYSSGNVRGMRPDIVGVVAQMTQAIATKRTYHELVFRRRADGKVGYAKIAWRPPSTCELIRDQRTGDLRGFRQYISLETAEAMRRHRDPRGDDVIEVGRDSADDFNYVRIPAARAAIHINGQHRNPVDGVSDLAVTHWAYKMQRKILLMWAIFLDGQSQPKVVTYGETTSEAQAMARSIATLRGSGVLGLKRPAGLDPATKLFDTLDTSGKGAEQFREMIVWLDQEMTRSVLAGFLDLTSNATNGVGSYALSADQSGLFLTSRQAAAKELASTVTDQIIAPLVRVNFGPDAAVPRLIFEKMSKDTTDKAMQMLQQLGSSQAMNVPAGFIDLLVERVAQHMDLADEKVEAMLKEQAEIRRIQAEAAGRSEQESETFQGKLTDNVDAAADVIEQHRKEKQ